MCPLLYLCSAHCVLTAFQLLFYSRKAARVITHLTKVIQGQLPQFFFQAPRFYILYM